MLYSNLKFKLVVTAIFTIFYSIPAFGQTAEEAQALHDKGRACFDANKIGKRLSAGAERSKTKP